MFSSNQMLQEELLYGGYIEREDFVVEIEPYISIYESISSNHLRGYAVEAIASDNGESFIGFFMSEKTARYAATRLLSRKDFPMFVIKENNEFFPVRRVRGVKYEDGPIMTLKHPDEFLALKNKKTFTSK
jgi:hypothetical protein